MPNGKAPSRSLPFLLVFAYGVTAAANAIAVVDSGGQTANWASVFNTALLLVLTIIANRNRTQTRGVKGQTTKLSRDLAAKEREIEQLLVHVEQLTMLLIMSGKEPPLPGEKRGRAK